MKIVSFWSYVAAALAAFSLASVTRAEDKPSEIRIAVPQVGSGNRPFVGGHSLATMHLKGLVEAEFAKDGIKVSWTFLRGAGPAVNELYANGLVDFSSLGDLPSIVGRASGLKTKILAATGIRQNTYLVVPSDSSIQSVKDLRGKRVAIFKGTNTQLAVAKILEANGLQEKDIRAINMDTATARAAIVTKDVDAAFGDYSYIALRDQGAAKIVYTTQGDPRYLRHGSFLATESFIGKYPSTVVRVLKQLITAAKWNSDQEKAPTPVYQLWAKSGYPYSNFKEDLKGQGLKLLSSPLLDGYFGAQFKQQINEAKRFGLIKNSFDYASWAEPRFLTQALKELGLENYWEQIGPTGASTRSTAAAPAPATGTTTASIAQ
jgi:sulfonate transport system substrate-binding protein